MGYGAADKGDHLVRTGTCERESCIGKHAPLLLSRNEHGQR
jgi:hypothetical protein